MIDNAQLDKCYISEYDMLRQYQCAVKMQRQRTGCAFTQNSGMQLGRAHKVQNSASSRALIIMYSPRGSNSLLQDTGRIQRCNVQQTEVSWGYSKLVPDDSSQNCKYDRNDTTSISFVENRISSNSYIQRLLIEGKINETERKKIT